VGEVRIGIDVGGTNTDAVLIDGSGNVLSRTKVPTTEDPIDGIASAMSAVRPAGDQVALVALGTTHAVNAIVQRRDLRRVTLIRIGAPGTEAVPPLAGWPEDLVRAAVARTAVVRGGVEVDGRVLPIDENKVRRFVEAVNPDAIAIVGTFSPLLPDQELEATELISEVSSAPVTMGHEVAGLGLLERENAAVLNAAIAAVIDRVVDALERSVERSFPGAAVFLTQNDGTLMAPAVARRLPVLTIGSGPSNSLRGAATLTGVRDGLVVDVGGTRPTSRRSWPGSHVRRRSASRSVA
jgi:N-methylhydantoinase A/oxoprolinase/acetone carboxylase beta subunit